MFALDFAYFNLIDDEKKGLVFRKPFLEILTPIFFKPRLEKLIEMREIRAKGCNIMLPLGQNNFASLTTNLQEDLVNKSLNIMQEYNIDYMAVDRKLKVLLPELVAGLPVIFGDDFIKALANVVIRETLTRHMIEKIIFIGETEGFADFLEVIATYELPLSIQSYNPHQYEIISHRMLYEKGCAISNSFINSRDWEKGDMVVNFNSDAGALSLGSPSLFYFAFNDSRVGMAPSLEESLEISGINPGMHSLAPILETWLKIKAGLLEGNAENNKANDSNGKSFLHLQAIGEKLGIWELFLDKGV